jgi:hypothetical protein
VKEAAMSFEAASTPVSPLVTALFDHGPPRRAWTLFGWGVAVSAHLFAAGLAFTEHRATARSPQPQPLELELAQPEPPPAAVVLPLPPQPTEHVLVKAAAAAPPQPARVGALITAKADPAPSRATDEPVDFTHDPGVLGFGSGVVAIGGKAQVGPAHAQLSPGAASTGTRGLGSRPAGEQLTPVSDLSQKPRLAESDPCRGYFPAGATDDVATAAVMVTIGRSGAVSSVQLLAESPAKQGFGGAARTCMASKHFSPGLDRDGNKAATAIRVNIRFSR